MPTENPTGTYRRIFHVPAGFGDRKSSEVRLRFDGVFDQETVGGLVYIMQLYPSEKMNTPRQINPKRCHPNDRDFILRIMKLDPPERPTAEELLTDKWFEEMVDEDEYREVTDLESIIK